MAPYQIIGVVLRQAVLQHFEAAARVRATTTLPSAGMRRSSLTAGTNQAVSGSRGGATTAKPNFDGRIAVISRHVAPASSERNTPLWCWHHTTCGWAAQRASRCTLNDRIFAVLRWHVLGIHTAVDEAPRVPHVDACPNARRRNANADVGGIAGIDQHRIDPGLLSASEAGPLPALGHMPQGHVQVPGCAAVIGAEQAARHGTGPQAIGGPPLSITHILPSDQGWGSSAAFSGFGGNIGPAISRHRPSRSRRHNLAPKWRRWRAAETAPSASAKTAETGSPRKCVLTISQWPLARELEETLAGPDMEAICHLPLR